MWQDEPAIAPDYLSNRQCADDLCDEIRLYWLKRGYGNVEAWAEPCFDKHRNTVWAVRSNLVGGRPVREGSI